MIDDDKTGLASEAIKIQEDTPGAISMHVTGPDGKVREALRIEPDGRFLVHGRETAIDSEVYGAAREFFMYARRNIADEMNAISRMQERVWALEREREETRVALDVARREEREQCVQIVRRHKAAITWRDGGADADGLLARVLDAFDAVDHEPKGPDVR